MHNQKPSYINWSYSGSTDISFGTGATTFEKALGYGAGLVALVFYSYFFLMKIYPWNYWQYLLASLLAFDVAGGLVCNCLNSCKRFYSASLQSGETSITVRLLKQHWFFTMIHIHPLIIQCCFGSSYIGIYGIFWYLTLQFSAFIVMKTPLYLQRPTAMLLCLIALLFNSYIIRTLNGFEWLIPALFIKIIYGHLVQEEPYRPLTEKYLNHQSN
ncbi:unnamed protein product [Rotaria sp. Silwood2]|nr:unnamed protein product [Rotaria sp. Silwood2]CAF2762437.1 unnamed protein product [Rotaria sp. Silwood2]CAF3128278.1 unnamed protein product [Rotaria sp. Silwood2]CAF3937382.1 unnamed protein product [Rotaria sp. Silwood2]CAF4307404.1 unnamed protein product [Rotaria sp. Silwood2]